MFGKELIIMGEIKSKTTKTTTYTTSDGRIFADQNALKNAKNHQTSLDLEKVLRPRVRALFGFSMMSPQAMEKDKNFSDDDLNEAYDKDQEILDDLMPPFVECEDFNEFFESMRDMLSQYSEPIEKLILFSKKYGVDSHKITKKSLEEK